MRPGRAGGMAVTPSARAEGDGVQNDQRRGGDLMTSTTVPTVDISALTIWMDEQGLGDGGAPVSVRFISGGSQNEVFEVSRGDFRSVLRIPPATAPASRDAGILREWRII